MSQHTGEKDVFIYLIIFEIEANEQQTRLSLDFLLTKLPNASTPFSSSYQSALIKRSDITH